MRISGLAYCLDEDYPTIQWNRHSEMADLWLRVDERHKAGKPIAKLLARIEYRLRLTSRWPKVDCLDMVPGLAFSARAREAFEALGIAGMQFLKFRVNGEPFFLFYTERVVDCLDRTTSEIRHGSKRGFLG